jgi:RNase H-like domain found in reverse transcriptase/Reverse transcriptase (RNA-dependent DNA polymerase)
LSSFVTPDGLYKFNVMPFGMVNAPTLFQRLMNSITQDIPNCHAYLDDIIIFSDDFNSHLDQLHLLIDRLTRANLTINLTKSHFCHATIEYLGHIVGNGMVKPVDAKVKAIREFPIPETRKQLRSFLGMAGYYRKFCEHFSVIACPLTDLLKKNSTFKWSIECDQAFNKLKDVLSNAPVLVTPNYSKPFKITVDSCDTGSGSVISQIGDDSLEHPLSYFSQKFDKHQKNYSTTEKELLGLILALKQFDFYVNGSPYPIDIVTDHNPLVFLSRVKQNQRIIRWSLFLQAYNLKISYLQGCRNVVADALSRV